ncbi:MAG: carboxypeptidase regulatory-like domain-containing protein [Gemmatimonadaceae bacterium]|nr:carboxypeptidase regulatory-like domain-containing protein [Gemmatimonadaceae bacterium]
MRPCNLEIVKMQQFVTRDIRLVFAKFYPSSLAWARSLVAAGITALTSSETSAQVFRGTVVESVSGIPMSGVIVTLFTTDGRVAAVGLTTETGNFALRAPAAGTYCVDAKRIGRVRASSPAVSLQQGETTDLRLAISPVGVSLPDVRVTSLNTCGQSPGGEHSLAELWEDTRAALTATRLTLEQHPFTATVVRYKQQLDPGSLRVRNEERSEQFGLIAEPFSSASADELHLNGYVINQADGSTLYRAPDANVLLSDSFLAAHCFRAQNGTGINSKLVGITFHPVYTRDMPDVTGTLWLDKLTHHLHSLDFRYTWLPNQTRNNKVGGHLEFARMPTGAWIIRRWWLRMPLFVTTVRPEHTGLPRVSTIRLAAIQEEGGEIITGTSADSVSRVGKSPKE